MAKPKGSTKQRGKVATNKQRASKGGKKSHGNGTKAPGKKGSSSRKRAASDGSDDNTTDGEPEELHPRSHKKARKGVEGEDSDEIEAEGVNESDDEEEEDVEEVEEAEEDSDKEASDLEERHQGDIPDSLALKRDTTKDLLTIFSEP
ncbi:hypothetical protein BJV78DRAFT_1286943 [Lactifluus subvellereus]|nr:hypothetical protein BJV78DRAFT_1286943 [Lactifluus subvellereus]